MERLVEARSNRLARGLRSLGVRSGDTIAVACCAGDGVDAAVAHAAARKLGAKTIAVTPEVARDDLAPAVIVLACEQGARLWKTFGVHRRVIADAPGFLWWKAFEGRHSDDPLEADVAC